MIRVAYVYYLITENQLGVENKIRQQASAIAAAGLANLDIIVLNPWMNEPSANVRYVKLKLPPFPSSYFTYLFRRYRLIERSVDLSCYDIIILRYPLADMTGRRFVKAHNVITEHHTDELAELEARLRLNAPLPQKIARRLLLLMEQRYGEQILRECAGLIAVTDEMRAMEHTRASGRPKSISVANGITARDVTLTGFRPFEGRELHAVFLATAFRPWHGLERVIDSFNRYQGSVKLSLHVVGDIAAYQLQAIDRDLQDVTFHGPMNRRELDELMRGMNLAVSTMALYKNNMQQGSPLKTREYTARGIPFLLGYADSDLREVPGDPSFHLQFDNDSSFLNIERILDFARDASKRPEELSRSMREHALKHMDWSAKMKRYLQFAEEVAQEQVDPIAVESRA